MLFVTVFCAVQIGEGDKSTKYTADRKRNLHYQTSSITGRAVTRSYVQVGTKIEPSGKNDHR